ncbi:hypothetical protein Avbf_07351 [Armadillidium vulgare]|nr:hypothetical protein Avbf_07351 [Armadillidium vulgare]
MKFKFANTFDHQYSTEYITKENYSQKQKDFINTFHTSKRVHECAPPLVTGCQLSFTRKNLIITYKNECKFGIFSEHIPEHLEEVENKVVCSEVFSKNLFIKMKAPPHLRGIERVIFAMHCTLNILEEAEKKQTENFLHKQEEKQQTENFLRKQEEKLVFNNKIKRKF